MKQGVFKHGRAEEWTSERIAQLSAQDIKQLRANAERLNEPGLAALCSGALKGKARPRAQAGSRQNRAPSTRARKLIARTKRVPLSTSKPTDNPNGNPASGSCK